MTDSKSVIKSKTIWGAILAGIPQILVIADSIGVVGANAPIINATVTLAGVAIAIVGRVKAKKNVTMTLPK